MSELGSIGSEKITPKDNGSSRRTTKDHDSSKKTTKDTVDVVDKFTIDVIPDIDVNADRKTLRSTFETMNSIMQHGEVFQKIQCIDELCTSAYFTVDPKISKHYVKCLVKTNLLETLVWLIREEDLNDIIFKDEEICKQNLGIVLALMNITNYNDVGKPVAEAGGIAYFTDVCKFPPFLDKLSNGDVYCLLLSTTAILHNIARISSVPQYFKDSKTADAMVPLFRQNEEERLQIYATCAAAQTCDESEINKLIDEKGVIKSILTYMKKAVDNKPSNTYGGAEIIELLDGIDKLAVADANKTKILDAGALPIFLEILMLDKPTDQSLTAKVLWTMSFDGGCATEIKSSTDLMTKLTELSKSKDKEVRSNVKGLLYNLDMKDRKVRKEVKPSKPSQQSGKHVFISYSWKQKEIVLQLKELLENKGVPLWIDTEQMRGSTLQAMAEAVENAQLVLICMSESYKGSPNCRLESENTFRLGKEYIPLMVQKYYKPDGWLGALLGTKLYIDFSGKYQFEPKWGELMKELRIHKILSSQQVTEDKITVTESRVRTQSSPKQNLSTTADVQNWLTVNNLAKLCPHFEDVNGEGLIQLKHMRHDAPDFFFKTLSKKQKLSLGEMLNLTAALDKL